MVEFDKSKVIAEAKEVLAQSQRVLDIAAALESDRPHQIAVFDDFRLTHGRLPTRNDFASELVAMIQDDLHICLQGKTCIDIGCRSGENGLAMQQAGAKVIGIDPDDAEFSIAIQGGMEQSRLYKMTLQEYQLQFPDQKFDLATVFLWNIPIDEQDAFLAALKKIIQPQGFAIIGYADAIYDSPAPLSVPKLMRSIFTQVERFEFPHRTNQYILKCTHFLNHNPQKTCSNALKRDPSGAVLQIGGKKRVIEGGIHIAWGETTASFGAFDQIYLYPPKSQASLKSSRLANWSSAFHSLVYSDEDIDYFLEKLPENDRIQALPFFYELEKRNNITPAQLARVVERFQSQFAIAAPALGMAVCSVIQTCLQKHWKSGAELNCCMQDGRSLYEDPDVFNEIIVNPYLTYEEIEDPHSQALWVTIRKI